MPESDAIGHRIYRSRFVDEIKNAGTTAAVAKSCLVVQAFNDRNEEIMTNSPTVQLASKYLLLAMFAIWKMFVIFLRDISQAYTQAETRGQRPIYIRPPAVLNISPSYILRVDRPLYGLPEAGMHWFVTYHKHHKTKLGMVASFHDPCPLFTPGCLAIPVSSSVPRGITCLQTDDTLNYGNESIMRKEDEMSTRFICKPKTILRHGHDLKFNGGIISLTNNGIRLSQPMHVAKLRPVEVSDNCSKEFFSQRARGAYIASVCRPNITFRFSVCAQVTKPGKVDAKRINKAIEMTKVKSDSGLQYKTIDPTSLRIAVFADASFASNTDLTSQL